MNSLGNTFGKVVTAGVKDQIQGAKAGMNEQKSKVDWEDWNWPPLIRFVHFSLEDCDEEFRP
jgi:hypothetical protein